MHLQLVEAEPDVSRLQSLQSFPWLLLFFSLLELLGVAGKVTYDTGLGLMLDGSLMENLV